MADSDGDYIPGLIDSEGVRYHRYVPYQRYEELLIRLLKIRETFYQLRHTIGYSSSSDIANDDMRPPPDGPGPDNGPLHPNVPYIPGISKDSPHIENPLYEKRRTCWDCGVVTDDWVLESREVAQEVWKQIPVHNNRRVCHTVSAEKERMDELAEARSEVTSLESQLKAAKEDLKRLEEKYGPVH